MMELALAVTLALATGFAGLWWGERQRRFDMQIREGKIPRKPAKAVTRGSAPTEAPRTDDGYDEAEAAYVQGAVERGFSEKEARADFAAMMGQINSEQREI